MRFLIVLLMVGLMTATEVSTITTYSRSKAYIDNGRYCELPHRPLSSRQGAVLVDSSGNGYSAWTNMQECLTFNPMLGYLQFVNRGYSPTGDLYVHQTNANFSFWVHDYVYDNSLHGDARYPTSVASDNPIIAFPVLDPGTGTWGHMLAALESGGWFSSFWDEAVDLSGDIGAPRCVGKQLPTGDILFIADLVDGTIYYMTWTSGLSTQLASGVLGTGEYWGFDINGGICYVFYYDGATLDIYYRTSTDGINWTAETQWDITWPTPYTNNVLYSEINKQMALTDAGNPILVFALSDGDDATYPYSSKTYVQNASGATPIQVSDDTYVTSWWTTIAAGGNYVVVLMHVWTNALEDSLARHDLFCASSGDNGATWPTPINITASVPERPGLAQLSKRLDVADDKFYYFYGVDMVNNHDPNWVVYVAGNLDPMAWYVGWHWTVAPGVEENKQSPNLLTPQLQIYPNPFSNRTKIRYMIQDAGYTIEEITISIYDAAGRLVKSFHRSTLDALRPTHITWQGDDDVGRPVPAGVYFVKLENGGNVIVKKIIKLK